jgi:hypothetical protein
MNTIDGTSASEILYGDTNAGDLNDLLSNISKVGAIFDLFREGIRDDRIVLLCLTPLTNKFLRDLQLNNAPNRPLNTALSHEPVICNALISR